MSGGRTELQEVYVGELPTRVEIPIDVPPGTAEEVELYLRLWPESEDVQLELLPPATTVHPPQRTPAPTVLCKGLWHEYIAKVERGCTEAVLRLTLPTLPDYIAGQHHAEDFGRMCHLKYVTEVRPILAATEGAAAASNAAAAAASTAAAAAPQTSGGGGGRKEATGDWQESEEVMAINVLGQPARATIVKQRAVTEEGRDVVQIEVRFAEQRRIVDGQEVDWEWEPKAEYSAEEAKLFPFTAQSHPELLVGVRVDDSVGGRAAGARKFRDGSILRFRSEPPLAPAWLDAQVIDFKTTKDAYGNPVSFENGGKVGHTVKFEDGTTKTFDLAKKNFILKRCPNRLFFESVRGPPTGRPPTGLIWRYGPKFTRPKASSSRTVAVTQRPAGGDGGAADAVQEPALAAYEDLTTLGYPELDVSPRPQRSLLKPWSTVAEGRLPVALKPAGYSHRMPVRKDGNTFFRSVGYVLLERAFGTMPGVTPGERRQEARRLAGIFVPVLHDLAKTAGGPSHEGTSAACEKLIRVFDYFRQSSDPEVDIGWADMNVQGFSVEESFNSDGFTDTATIAVLRSLTASYLKKHRSLPVPWARGNAQTDARSAAARAAGVAAGGGDDQSLRDVFAKIDQNNDGSVSKKELILALRRIPDLASMLKLPEQVRQEGKSREMFEKVSMRLANRRARCCAKLTR